MKTSDKESPRFSSQAPPKMPGALPLFGHMLKFGKNPFLYMMNLRNSLGEIGDAHLWQRCSF